MIIESEIVEADRLSALRSIGILDTPREKCFDNITTLAAKALDMPMVLLSFMDETRQWYKSTYGIEAIENPKDISICQYTLQKSSVFEIKDTHLDARFIDNAFVTGAPFVRFYAGVPLTSQDGHKLGTLCVIDSKPRELNQHQRDTLMLLAEQAISVLSLHQQNNSNTLLNQKVNETQYILNELSKNMPALVVYWDKDQICRFASHSYCEQIDKTIHEVIGQPYDDIVPEKLAKIVKPKFLKALSGEMSDIILGESVFKDSQVVRHGQYIPDYDESGEVQGVLIVITDITFQHRAEKHAALFSRVIGHSSDCILITGTNFEIEYSNKSFTKVTHYQLDEIAGKTPDFLFTGQQTSSLTEIKKALNKTDHWQGELWHTKKNGGKFFALVSIDVIRNSSENITHYIFSLRDQTENEKMRSNLFIMTDMLNRTGKMAKVGGWEFNLISKNLLWTEEVFRIHELPSTFKPSLDSAIEFYPTEAKEILTRAIETASEDGRPWDLELPFITANKNHRWVRATGECIQFNNKPLKLTGTFQDITDRKLAELQKEQEEIKHRNTLIKEVHHRIKNNLQGVSGILSNFAEQNPTQAEMFNEANAQLQSVAVIYGLQSNRPDASIEIGELSYAIKNNIERLWQNDISYSIDENWVKAFTNKNESVPLALIINELITNAVKHQINKNSVKIILKHLTTESSGNSNIKNKVLILISNHGEDLPQATSSDPLIQNKTQSGLALMSTLMPKRGAYIQWDIQDKMIQVSLELSYPVIRFEKELTPRENQYEQ